MVQTQALTFLEFEKPVAELAQSIRELKESAQDSPVDLGPEISRLEAKVDRLLRDTYARLSPWQKTQVARHPQRPHFSDIVGQLTEGFTPFAGDRSFGEDAAIIGGLARLRGRSVMVIGTEKGADTASRVRHNFGMARPEGYRKATRLMALADRFGIPVITIVDTPGAYPGVDAEERGQAEAIATSTAQCLTLGVPLVAAVIGEGGSGGAVVLATGNRLLMFEHSIYSVISPEGCASILWRTAERAEDAADAMKVTAADMLRLGVADRVVDEPIGGAHRDRRLAIDMLGHAIVEELESLVHLPPEALRRDRREKYLRLSRL